jgi:hypothetical protein
MDSLMWMKLSVLAQAQGSEQTNWNPLLCFGVVCFLIFLGFIEANFGYTKKVFADEEEALSTIEMRLRAAHRHGIYFGLAIIIILLFFS